MTGKVTGKATGFRTRSQARRPGTERASQRTRAMGPSRHDQRPGTRLSRISVSLPPSTASTRCPRPPARLIGLGLGECARLVACTAAGRGHLVLAVDGTADTLILDNRVPGLWSWRRGPMARLRWRTRSVPGRLAWERVQDPITLADLARRLT